MEPENGQPALLIKPEDTEIKKTSLVRTLLSLVLFIGVYYAVFQSWFSVLSLVTVIVIHEAGHFIAMKFFGYQAVNMTFIPFIGAYVSGQAVSLSRKNKLIVLLAGPLPGIVIGCIVFYVYRLNGDQDYMLVGLSFLALNGFNLLPVFPLDGGQFLRVLFFDGSRIVQLIFLYLSLAMLMYGFFFYGFPWGILLIAFLIFLRIGAINFIFRVRKQLDEDGVDYACSYDDLTDEAYWQIRNVVIDKSKSLSKKYSTEEQSDDEQPLVKHIENVLKPAYDNDLSVKGKWLFLGIWLTGILIPLLQWAFYKGWA